VNLSYLLFGLLLLSWQSWGADGAVPTTAPSKFAGEVGRFAASPPPVPGGVLLVGSSTFKRWTNAVQDLSPLPITNRAFGGSQTSHQLMFFDQVVSPCHPKLIVWYCGSNDVKGKKEPQSILQRTEEWLDKVMKYDSSIQVLLVSIHRCPQKHRDSQIVVVDAVNHGYEKIARSKEGVFYVDVNPALQSLTGKPRAELYVEDGLHLNREGYYQMNTLLKPAIEKIWGR
jgi:hypothetical protein